MDHSLPPEAFQAAQRQLGVKDVRETIRMPTPEIADCVDATGTAIIWKALFVSHSQHETALLALVDDMLKPECLPRTWSARYEAESDRW